MGEGFQTGPQFGLKVPLRGVWAAARNYLAPRDEGMARFNRAEQVLLRYVNYYDRDNVFPWGFDVINQSVCAPVAILDRLVKKNSGRNPLIDVLEDAYTQADLGYSLDTLEHYLDSLGEEYLALEGEWADVVSLQRWKTDTAFQERTIKFLMKARGDIYSDMNSEVFVPYARLCAGYAAAMDLPAACSRSDIEKAFVRAMSEDSEVQEEAPHASHGDHDDLTATQPYQSDVRPKIF